MDLLKVEQLTESKYLNMYKLKLRNKIGKHKDYYIASRRKKDQLSCITKKNDICDGVMILPITTNNEVIILRQYRAAVDDFLYELPAGMVDDGETIEEAAIRELYEETGLKCKKMDFILKPSYSSVGISDETTAIVQMLVEGEISSDNLEENEEIEVIKIKIEDVKEFVKNHNMSIKGALTLLTL